MERLRTIIAGECPPLLIYCGNDTPGMTRLVSVNPADLTETEGPEATVPGDVPGIVESIRNVQSRWCTVPPGERIKMVRNLRMLLSDRADEIALTIHRDTGKPRCECYSTEILSCTAMAKYCESLLGRFRFTERVDQGPMSLMCSMLGRRSYIEHVPYGVIAIISSYNFPLAIPFTEALMAVSAGNGVIIKPSSDTPLTGALMERLFAEAGFPEGLVRVVNGRGVGSAITSAGADKIVFTGGTDTGSNVMSAASSTVTPVILELGGKDAFVVLNDADLERATDCALWSSFVNSGQVCVSTKRIYLQEGIADRFREMFVAKVEGLRQGNGWDDEEVSVGPMINETELHRMEELCDMIVKEGGRFLTGGRRNDALQGYYFRPTVVDGLPKDSGITDVEMFGPIVSLYTFRDDEEAVALANGCCFALGGSVWSNDIARARRLASRMHAGTVDVNNSTYTFGLPATPWGGRHLSGIGTTHAEEGFRQMMHPHHVHVDTCRFKRDAWWMPYRKGSSDAMKGLNEAFFGRGKGKVSAIRSFLRMTKRE